MAPMIRILVVGALAVISGLPCRAVERVEHGSGQVLAARQWEVVDVCFEVEDVPGKATDADFSAVIEGGEGRRFEVPGFYNGGREFLIRFTPPVSGVWDYETRSSVAALNGLKGALKAQEAEEGRRGAVTLDSDAPRQFRYENGDRYYPIAFECDWLFALDAENGEDIPATRKFVDQLAGYGFNQVVMNVFAYDVNWKKDDKLVDEFEYGSPKVFPFGGDNEKPDYSRLDIEFFQRLDRVIEYLDHREIAAHLMIYVWNKRVSWPEAGSEADNRYFDYVVKRYQAFPNLVWDISKEALGYGRNDVNYITQRIDRLRKLDAFKRLVTVHDYSYCRRFPKKLDFISVQLWQSELHSVMRKVCADFPGQPILNIEHGGYEESPYEVFNGNYTSAEVCLERAYQCVFAGTFPTHYWQGAAWNVIIPDIEAMEAEERPKLDYYRHLRTLVERYGLGELKAGEKKSNSGFSLTNGKDLTLYYVPKENDYFGVRLPKSKMGQTMTGTWFDPFEGTFAEPVKKKVVQWPAFKVPEGEGFRVLILETSP